MRGFGTGLPAARPQASFETLPARLDLSPSRAVAVGHLILTVIAVAFVVLFRVNLGPAASPSDPTVAAITTGIPLVVLGLGLLAGARGVLMLLSRREARFDASAVHVTGRTPFGREEWSLPLSAFEGVAWRIVRRRRRRGPPRVWQVIELVHPEPARTLPLHVRQSRADARAEWESIARALGLPAIDARDGTPHVRAADDLDKSVRDLAAEGKARLAWQPGSEPPAGLSWQSAGNGGAEALVVRLHARRFPVWLYAAVAAVGAVLLVVGLRDGAILGSLIAAAMVGVVAWYWLAEPRRPRELRLTRSDLAVSDPLLPRQGPDSLPLEAIEEIRVVLPRSRLAGAGTLLIASDRGEIRTGHGLSAEALAWLRDYLTAAVAEA